VGSNFKKKTLAEHTTEFSCWVDGLDLYIVQVTAKNSSKSKNNFFVLFRKIASKSKAYSFCPFCKPRLKVSKAGPNQRELGCWATEVCIMRKANQTKSTFSRKYNI
jgi:hypothetical protein